MKESVDAVLQDFIVDVKNMATSEIINKWIILGGSQIFPDNQLYELKNEISKHFHIHVTQIYLVGSSKLGFSIKPQKRYSPFGESSDIDLAIISAEKFNEFWVKLYEYENSGGYWPRISEFKRYFWQGWMRPDKLPPNLSFSKSHDWWDFFEKMSSQHRFGPYKIRAGLYQSNYFFESYQSICVDLCKEGLNENLSDK